MFTRRTVLASGAALLAASGTTVPLSVLAQSAGTTQSTITIGMALEPPSLDPTANAASAVGEITLYNLYETLTKINADGSVSPLLAESWEVSSDLKTYTFRLRKESRFHNGEPFNAEAVKFSFDRAKASNSINKDKATFAKLNTDVLDDYTVRISNSDVEPELLFMLGQATAIIVEPKSAAKNASTPTGTGPYQLVRWSRGTSLSLKRWDDYPRASQLRIQTAVFKFIADPAAQVASLLAGDVDAFPRVSPRSVQQFETNAAYQTVVSGSRAKTILAINNRRKPLDDVRVRRAIAAAIDRRIVIEGAGDGYGAPIGSHYVPGAFGFVDTTGINPYDPDKAVALLKEAGIKTPLKLRMALPPPPYARQGGIVIAALLAKVGIQVELENVEWAQWLSNVMAKHHFDLTMISHVEPFDLGNYANPDYYWGYNSEPFQKLFEQIKGAVQPAERARLLGNAQRMLAEDSVNAFLYQPQWVTVANKNIRGLWRDMPVFVNDLSALRWTN
ncbi:ABC transporter substrate-binding protein [Lampropedia puyangensis]|uniref:ABC transporter substrate-binding protein n=1 Tax=Lampropedia puyangensis TaxID=1330072 RepID=A0A4S8FCV3_9BURK|nr:ABC transporter substrate-binding protein [Lampropedia puyangensis]THU05360.1 ABC transporter substrate-binding protein [Lampropedia puyangensis]